MSDEIVITTPENVKVTYEIAGLGSRCIAVLIDSMFIALISLVLLILFIAFEALFPGTGSWGFAVFVLLNFIITEGYFIFFEIKWKGLTPGKRNVGIRVMRDGGFGIDSQTVIIRNLMRIVDFLPACYGIGLVTIFLHPQCKRLGDIAAGSIVVRERPEEMRREPQRLSIEVQQYAIINPDITLLKNVPEAEIELAQCFMERERSFESSPINLKEYAYEISKHLMTHVTVDKDKVKENPELFIEEFLSLYRKQNDIII